MCGHVAAAVIAYVGHEEAVRIAARTVDLLIGKQVVSEWGYDPDGELLYEPTSRFSHAYIVLEEEEE